MSQTNWQGRCHTGVARADITPPVGIYHRMWGAAKHDRSEGVHRPLTATCIAFAPIEFADLHQECQVLLAVDHCLLEAPEVAAILGEIESVSGISPDRVTISFSHTHAAGLLSRARADLPGGDLIGPYLDSLRVALCELVSDAMQAMEPANWAFAQGNCQLASNRDSVDPSTGESVCGNNPDAETDDAVVVAGVWNDESRCLATVVNYACHPTTLAWDNRLISPDYPGAMREVVETAMKSPCVFLQGASGDLGPVEGFVGDCEVADRNGRQLGYAALSALESLPEPTKAYEYAGPVVSGATIGEWKWMEFSEQRQQSAREWSVDRRPIGLDYRDDLPSIAEVNAECLQLESEEHAARERGDESEAARLRALAERKRRMKERLSGLPAGPQFPFNAAMWRVGDAIWVSVQGEPYNCLQRRLRAALPNTPIVVATIANGWGPSYMPPRELYGKGVYQESIAALAPGTLEQLTNTLIERATALVSSGPAGG